MYFFTRAQLVLNLYTRYEINIKHIAQCVNQICVFFSTIFLVIFFFNVVKCNFMIIIAIFSFRTLCILTKYDTFCTKSATFVQVVKKKATCTISVQLPFFIYFLLVFSYFFALYKRFYFSFSAIFSDSTCIFSSISFNSSSS